MLSISDWQTKHTTHHAPDFFCTEQVIPSTQLRSSQDNTLNITYRKTHMPLDVSGKPATIIIVIINIMM
jgi:hypothetical protein